MNKRIKITRKTAAGDGRVFVKTRYELMDPTTREIQVVFDSVRDDVLHCTSLVVRFDQNRDEIEDMFPEVLAAVGNTLESPPLLSSVSRGDDDKVHFMQTSETRICTWLAAWDDCPIKTTKELNDEMIAGASVPDAGYPEITEEDAWLLGLVD